MKYAFSTSGNFNTSYVPQTSTIFQRAVWNKLVVWSLLVVRILLNGISRVLPLGREIVLTITKIIYRHASRVKIIVYSIRPAKSTIVKESLYSDLDSIYYRIFNNPIRFCCCMLYNHKEGKIYVVFIFFPLLFFSFAFRFSINTPVSINNEMFAL